MTIARLALCAATLSGMPGPAPASAQGPFTFARGLMGTEFRVVIHAPDSAAAGRAADAAFRRIEEIESALSHYDPTSELSRLSATAGSGRWVPVSDDLWELLEASRGWSERSAGAFDVTVGALTRLWRHAARRGTLPSDTEIEAARRTVGYRLVELDPGRRAARLTAPGTLLDTGGIGKGYAADAALEVLRELGYPSALVDAGGDVALGDPPPGGGRWRIGLFRPAGAEGVGACTLRAAGMAVATSGDTYRYVEVEGVRHSHVVDPRTGRAITRRRVVTVVAPTATAADALASALSVTGTPPEGRPLFDGLPGAAARILVEEPGGWRVHWLPTAPPSLSCEVHHAP